jgi:hypothetical protein
MAFLDKMKDVGRRMIGQGREVKFKNEVEEYASRFGVPPGEAEKTLFVERLRDVRIGLTSKASMASFHELFGDMEAALRETVDDAGIEACLADATSPAARPLALPPLTAREHGQATSYFQQRHEKKSPGFAVTKDTAQNMQLMLGLMRRLETDPRYAAAPSLERLLTDPANADIRADVGMVLLSRRQIADHERGFGNQMRFEKNAAELKEAARELPAKLLLEPVLETVKGLMTIAKGKASFESVLRALRGVGTSLGKGAWQGVKTLNGLVKTVSAMLTKREK